MITKRIIPCLDVRNGRVVKGVNFTGIADVADPVELADLYSKSGADELVFYDITASFEERAIFTDILKKTAERVFIPLTVGGGINTLEDFARVLACGADKVSVNSGAIKDPSLVRRAAKRYGDQCVVLSVDAKRVEGEFIRDGSFVRHPCMIAIDQNAGNLYIGENADTDFGTVYIYTSYGQLVASFNTGAARPCVSMSAGCASSIMPRNTASLA